MNFSLEKSRWKKEKRNFGSSFSHPYFFPIFILLLIHRSITMLCFVPFFSINHFHLFHFIFSFEVKFNNKQSSFVSDEFSIFFFRIYFRYSLRSFTNFSLEKSDWKREKRNSDITFCTIPLFFRTWLRMPARPPWRTTIKVMGSEYLEPDIPSHERFGAPSNLRAAAFPPFLDSSRLLSSPLSFQTFQPRDYSMRDFSKTLLSKAAMNFIVLHCTAIANICAENISLKLCESLPFEIFNSLSNFFEVMSRATQFEKLSERDICQTEIKEII